LANSSIISHGSAFRADMAARGAALPAAFAAAPIAETVTDAFAFEPVR
jgi:hypothetical protein